MILRDSSGCNNSRGGFGVDGKGTNVWRLLDVWVERPKRNCVSSIGSSHSMDGSKKGKRLAKWFKCIIARARW